MKRALADVLWEAANRYLSHDAGRYGKSVWTCNAVARAAGGNSYKDIPAHVAEFLRGLGCRLDFEWYTFDAQQGTERQGVRYMWLLLAMHVAEDEGIMVEVAK